MNQLPGGTSPASPYEPLVPAWTSGQQTPATMPDLVTMGFTIRDDTANALTQSLQTFMQGAGSCVKSVQETLGVACHQCAQQGCDLQASVNDTLVNAVEAKILSSVNFVGGLISELGPALSALLPPNPPGIIGPALSVSTPPAAGPAPTAGALQPPPATPTPTAPTLTLPPGVTVIGQIPGQVQPDGSVGSPITLLSGFPGITTLPSATASALPPTINVGIMPSGQLVTGPGSPTALAAGGSSSASATTSPGGSASAQGGTSIGGQGGTGGTATSSAQGGTATATATGPTIGPTTISIAPAPLPTQRQAQTVASSAAQAPVAGSSAPAVPLATLPKLTPAEQALQNALGPAACGTDNEDAWLYTQCGQMHYAQVRAFMEPRTQMLFDLPTAEAWRDYIYSQLAIVAGRDVLKEARAQSDIPP